MKRKLHTLLRSVIGVAARPVMASLHALRILRPRIYVRVDGGLASQIHFYLLGKWFGKNVKGRVIYDLQWYVDNGMDLDGRFARNFDLLRFAPGIIMKSACRGIMVSLYRILYRHVNNYEASPSIWQSLRAPVYLDGYYPPFPGFYNDIKDLIIPDPVGLTSADRHYARLIDSEPDAVGMHVRRGDLAKEVYAYGSPASDSYFSEAVSLLSKRHGSPLPIFVFSDEPDWVREHLLPRLPHASYHVMDLNGSDKGYIDLWLLSKCRHFISSKGSFGKFGALLSPRRGDLIICDDKESLTWLQHIPTAISLPL